MMESSVDDQHTIYQIVIEDNVTGETVDATNLRTIITDANVGSDDGQNIRFISVDSSDEAALVEDVNSGTGEDGTSDSADGGGVTYIVENADLGSGLIQIRTVGSSGEDGVLALDVSAATGDVLSSVGTAVQVEGDDENNRFILQYPNYTHELFLQGISQAAALLMDLAVFCRDGVAWTNRLIMASVSPMMLESLSSLDSTDGACLVMPEVSKLEFASFQKALLVGADVPEKEQAVLSRVAEVLGCSLEAPRSPRKTTARSTNSGQLPSVNYRSMLDNYHEKKRVLHSLGFDADAFDSDASSRRAATSVLRLAAVLDGEVECAVCGRDFVDEASLQKHTATLHTPKLVSSYVRPSGVYSCDICEAKFSFAINVKKHKWLAHSKSRRDDDGEENLRPAVQPDPAQAKRNREREKFEDMKCKICGFEASTWKQLQVHVMDHTKERPYKCDICKKGFKEPQKLKRHRISHTGEKNHVCGFCGKAFGLRHNMKSHERIHLGQGHVCAYCGKSFSQAGNLRDHERQHARKKHVASEDPEVRKRQQFVKTRGRPSIADIDRKRALEASMVMDEDEEDPDDPAPMEADAEETNEAIEQFVVSQTQKENEPKPKRGRGRPPKAAKAAN